MTRKQTIVLAVAGVALLAVSRAQAGFTWSDGDLLVDYRDVTTTSDPDVTIDLGNVNTFVSTITGLSGGTAVLDTVSGVTPTTGYTATYAWSDVTGLLGTPASGNLIGFTAGTGTQDANNTLWLTRSISAPNADGTGLTMSAQQGNAAQNTTYLALKTIGNTAGASGTQLANSSANAVSLASGTAGSYQLKGQATGNPALINYAGSQNTAGGAGGPIEIKQNGTTTTYSALWEVPDSGTGSDTYLGYFTYKPTGELDFTAATVATPEPSTYALFGLGGVLAFLFRRKLRALAV
jgi:hypothetical protein